jgi:hypothetical protein
MRSVRAARSVDATVHEAETCWYDTSRWSAWVDGLERIVTVSRDWPGRGAGVVWQSGPAGRGRVSERVIAHEPLSGQTVEVSDDSISGRQTVAFVPAAEGVEVALTLEYELRRRSVVTPMVDLLFIRRAMEGSLASTLAHFAIELADRR